jgi:hypothetical protein
VAWYFLELCWAKTLIIGVPLILSVIGLYCLVKNRTLRVKTFYTCHALFHPDTTNYIFVTINDNSSEIAPVAIKHYQQQTYSTFRIQLLDYMIVDSIPYPIGSNQHTQLWSWLASKDPAEVGL